MCAAVLIAVVEIAVVNDEIRGDIYFFPEEHEQLVFASFRPGRLESARRPVMLPAQPFDAKSRSGYALAHPLGWIRRSRYRGSAASMDSMCIHTWGKICRRPHNTG